MIRQHEVQHEWSPRMVMHLNYIFGWCLPCDCFCGSMSITSDGYMIGNFHGPEGEHSGAFHGKAQDLSDNLEQFILAEDFSVSDLHALNVILLDKYTDHSGGAHAVQIH